jgi:hypothetical protein
VWASLRDRPEPGGDGHGRVRLAAGGPPANSGRTAGHFTDRLTEATVRAVTTYPLYIIIIIMITCAYYTCRSVGRPAVHHDDASPVSSGLLFAPAVTELGRTAAGSRRSGPGIFSPSYLVVQ